MQSHPQLLDELQQTLRMAANPDRAKGEQRYLKSTDTFLGVSVPAGDAIVRAFRKAHPRIAFPEVRALSCALWSSEIHEEKRLAVQLLDGYHAALTAAEWPLLAQWVRESGSWDLVDDIAVHLLSELLDRYAHFDAEIDTWIHDGDFWVRRAALVCHVLRLRHGSVSPQHVFRLCDSAMADREYFVRKALGWVLRECAGVDPDATVAFLRQWRTASRLILREAVRKLDSDRQRLVLGSC